LKHDGRTRPVRFQTQAGGWMQACGLKGKIATRERFPQPCNDLKVRWCSPVLKIQVAEAALNNDPAFQGGGKVLFLTGERRQEGGRRKTYAEKEPPRCDRKKRRVDAWRPVIDWDEARVWETIRRWRVRPHPAYRLGFPRVSCMTCVFGGPDQWASVRAIAPARFDRIAAFEAEFGCTIKRGVNIEQLANRGTPYPACEDAALVRLAMSEGYPAVGGVVPEGEEWVMPAGAFGRGGGPS